MVRLQTLDLRIGVRVPASQPSLFQYSPQVKGTAIESDGAENKGAPVSPIPD